MVANGFSVMSSLQMVVETFSRFSRLLDANFDAMHGSFTSIVRLSERLGHLNTEVMTVIKTFTLFRLFQTIAGRALGVFRYLTGSKSQQAVASTSGFGLQDYQEFSRRQQHPPGWGAFLVVCLVTFVGLPLLLNKLFRLLSRAAPKDPMELEWNREKMEGKPSLVRALYNFEAESGSDLPFSRGDTLTILSKTFPDWWEAELNGRVGLIPANYVEPLDKQMEGGEFSNDDHLVLDANQSSPVFK